MTVLVDEGVKVEIDLIKIRQTSAGNFGKLKVVSFFYCDCGN